MSRRVMMTQNYISILISFAFFAFSSVISCSSMKSASMPSPPSILNVLLRTYRTRGSTRGVKSKAIANLIFTRSPQTEYQLWRLSALALFFSDSLPSSSPSFSSSSSLPFCFFLLSALFSSAMTFYLGFNYKTRKAPETTEAMLARGIARSQKLASSAKNSLVLKK